MNDPEEVRTIPLGGKVEANPATGTEQATDICVQPLMVFHPMQGGIRERDVELRREAEIVDIHPDKLQVPARLGLGGSNHTLGGVDAQDLTVWDKSRNLSGESAIAAPKVENALRPFEVQFGDQRCPPFLLVGRGLRVSLAVKFVDHFLLAEFSVSLPGCRSVYTRSPPVEPNWSSYHFRTAPIYQIMNSSGLSQPI
jgi:hypothetical protein